MKKFSIIVVYVLIIGAILLIILPKSWFPPYIDVRYTGWTELLAAAIIYFMPRFLGVSSEDPDVQRKNRGVEIFQFTAAVAVFADFLGAVGLYQLYQIGIPYGYILHVCTSFFITVMFSFFFEKRYSVPRTKAIIFGFFLAMVLGGLWEVLENSADHFLGTHLAGPDQTTAKNTTALNLWQDFSGSALAAVIMFVRERVKLKNKNIIS